MKVKTLLAVIEAGSYTKAAQRLNLTQPAVGHQIRPLENEFGIKIFYRSENKLKLTPQGKIPAQHVHKAVVVYSNACQAIADNRTETSHLNVGITPTAGETIIPQVLTTLYNENPDIYINICIDTIQKVYSRLKAYELDLTVAEGRVPSTVLVSATLNMDYLYLAVSPMHRLNRAKAVSVEEIRYERLILHSRSTNTRQLFEKHLGAKDMSLAEFNVIMELDNVSMVRKLITMDLGITIIAKSAYREGLVSSRLAIIPIGNSSMVRQINMIYQEDFLHPEPIRDIRGIYEQLKVK